MKKWFAVTVCENDKYYAYGISFSENDNILSKLAVKKHYTH